jgi:hypothetical protein
VPTTPGSARAYRIRPGQPLTIDVHGRDGTHLQVRGILDTAPELHTSDIATRIVLVDAQARVLD